MIATDRFVLHEVHHHPGPYRGRTAIMRRLASDGLVAATADGWKLTAKGVGEVTDEDIQQIKRLQDSLVAAIAERDALQALVAEQCEALAEMVPDAVADEAMERAEKAEKEAERHKSRADGYAEEVVQLEEYAEFATNAADYLEGYMLALFGERRPVRPIEPVELRRLVDFIFEGG